MRKINISLVLVFLMFSVHASRTRVSTASEINNGSWKAGDTIVMINGTWTNQAITLKAEGSAEQPIVLMAETPGEVILNGSSYLYFSGKYIHITGLFFKDGDRDDDDIIAFRTSSSILAENCRISNIAIENYNPTINTKDSKWVSIYGKNNQVDHCSFVNKTNSGTLLVVWLKSGGEPPNHIIDHNYFGYRNANVDASGSELNGQEIIRIGDSKTSMQTAGVVVSNNFFEHCNGEIEIISSKSCENIYTNNMFYECVGMLTLRHGNRCTVEGNYFIGNGISRTGGVRIIGEDHKVYNNYFERLEGSEYRSALCIVRGKENSALNEYFQVKNALVAFNTMVDCKNSFTINYNSDAAKNLPPIGTTIAHNHVYNTSGSNINVGIYQINVAAMELSWKNNLMNQGIFYFLTPDSSEVVTGIEPSMALAGTNPDILEPGEGSALAGYSINEYPEVSVDLRGRDRNTIKMPGASQLSGTIVREMPTKETTGADYYTPAPPSTKIVMLAKTAEFKAYAVNGELFSTVSEPGTLAVYNLSGRCLHQQKMSEGSNITKLSSKGMFILRFQSDGGAVATRKIISY
ncbi:chondroitinase-B domain-containing protein [Bacteroidota bacterium]